MDKKKIFLTVTLNMVITIGIFAGSVRAEENIAVIINGAPLVSDVAPIVVEGRTLAPLRAISEAMGVSVNWVNESQMVAFSNGTTTYTLQIDNPTVIETTDGRTITNTIDVPPTIINSRTFVPVRFLAESLNVNISYDGTTNTVYVGEGLSITNDSQIINPSEEFVISKLNTISVVTGIQTATEENDPNGKLHKAGGYNSAVYFSTSYIDQNSVRGKDIVDKGTDCGGQIEVYSTVEDAEKRNTELSIYDGTFLDSGSHKVLGTMVIRISSKSTATEQNYLTELIVDAFTNDIHTNVNHSASNNITPSINNNTTSSTPFYANHSYVPDFGAIFNVPLRSSNDTDYVYELSNISPKEMNEYHDVLEENGFVPYGAGGSIAIYKKDNISVTIMFTDTLLFVVVE